MANVRTDVYDDSNWYKNASVARKGVLYCIHDYKHGICRVGVSDSDEENIAKSYIEHYPFDVELHLLKVESRYHAQRYALWLLDDFKIKSSWYKIDPHQFLRMEDKIKEVTAEVINRYKESPEFKRSEVERLYREERKRRDNMPYECDHCGEKFDIESDVISHVKQCDDRSTRSPTYREKTKFGYDLVNKIRLGKKK